MFGCRVLFAGYIAASHSAEEISIVDGSVLVEAPNTFLIFV